MPIIETIRWKRGRVRLIDQTLLPERIRFLQITDVRDLWEAIRSLRVRGAPAIGIAAAFGVYLGIRKSGASTTARLIEEVNKTAAYLATARPTAVNLFWALERMKTLAAEHAHFPPLRFKKLILDTALGMIEEDIRLCREIGRHGAELIPHGARILTHCNTGGLATAGFGTALGVICTAHEQGKAPHVFVDETRPLLQGARLNVWELRQWGIPCTLICDNMAAVVMQQGRVDCVIVGADRIAANGDTANKVGTYGLACLARIHRIPFYVAAPLSSFDATLSTGADIPIEQRPAEEITEWGGRRIAVKDAGVFNPAFDVTPARLITAIVTQSGILRPPYRRRIRAVLDRSSAGGGAAGPCG
ncbi:MAG: S-methyl-5-thioribose-1-phosphate isomerase [Candidatus Sumerlaeia bacterium]